MNRPENLAVRVLRAPRGVEIAPRALADVLTGRDHGTQLIRIGELPDALRQVRLPRNIVSPIT